jgi:hypothetical protein
MRPTDGLLGMWAHTFDSDGDIDRQFQILRRSGDGYIVQLYSLEDGHQDGMVVIPRKTILENRVYHSHYGMNDAMVEIDQKRRQVLMATYQAEGLRIVS